MAICNFLNGFYNLLKDIYIILNDFCIILKGYCNFLKGILKILKHFWNLLKGFCNLLRGIYTILKSFWNFFGGLCNLIGIFYKLQFAYRFWLRTWRTIDWFDIGFNGSSSVNHACTIFIQQRVSGNSDIV